MGKKSIVHFFLNFNFFIYLFYVYELNIKVLERVANKYHFLFCGWVCEKIETIIYKCEQNCVTI